MSCVCGICSKRIKKNQRNLSCTFVKIIFISVVAICLAKNLSQEILVNIGTVNCVMMKLTYLLTTLKVIISLSWNCLECLKTNCTVMNL